MVDPATLALVLPVVKALLPYIEEAVKELSASEELKSLEADARATYIIDLAAARYQEDRENAVGE